MLTPLVTFVVALRFTGLGIDPDLSIVWLLTSFTLIASAAGLYYLVAEEMHRAVETIQKTSSNIESDIKKILHDELQYTTIPLSDVRNLRIEASNLYRSVLATTDPNSKHIWYFGGASLQPTPEELSTIQQEADEKGIDIERNPAIQIRDLFSRLTERKSDIIFERHVHLPTETEFRARGLPYKKKIISWLKNQRELTFNNPDYRLKRSSRAPDYGSFVSFLAGNGVIIQINGDGRGGAITRNRALQTTFVKNIIAYFDDAQEKNKPLSFGRDNIRELDDLIKKYQAVYDEG